MSTRGSRPGQGRGRPRGSMNKPKTTIWEWETYKPGPEVYNDLFRLHRAPPTITHALPNECPIPNARSQILNRRQTEDGFLRNYYNVRITYFPAADDMSSADGEVEEETLAVDISRILKLVSRRELERFEDVESGAEAKAEAAARRADAEELAHRRLEKNSRGLGSGKGRGMLSGLGLGPEVRSRGRPRGRGKGRGRGSWRRGGMAVLGESAMGYKAHSVDLADAEPREALPTEDGHSLQHRIAETDSEEESEEEPRPKRPSPELHRSSFVAYSALPTTPRAAHHLPIALGREVSEVDVSDAEDDQGSISGAAAQLQLEGFEQHTLSSDSERDKDRHRAKGARTESAASSRPRIATTSFNAQRSLSHASSIDNIGHTARHESQSTLEKNSEEENIMATSSFSRHRDASLIEDYLPAHNNDENIASTIDDGMSDAEEYVINAILEHSYFEDVKYYLVKWQGYEDSSDWLPEAALTGATELVAKYNEIVKNKKGKQPVQ